MDERFNRRLLLLIAGLVLVLLAVAVLTLREFVTGIDGLVKWPMWLAVSFNVMVLVATAVITVGHFDRRLVARFFALVLACKAVGTVLTAAGFLLTSKQALAGIWPAVSGALLEAGLESWTAFVLHAIGALVVARVLRSMVMGRQLAIEAPPEGIILPTLTEPEMLAGGSGRTDEMWLAPPEPGVDPFTSPATAEREQAEGEEELDRVVAAAAPATADLETMPDQPMPELEPEEVVGHAEPVSEAEAVAEEEVAREVGVVPDLTPEPVAAAEEEGVLGSVTELAPEEAEPWAPEPAVPEAAAPEEPKVAEVPEPPEEPAEPVPEAAVAEPAAVEPATKVAGAPSGGANEIILTVGEILGCFPAEDVALSQSEVREERGGDEYVRVPLDVVLPQIENGVVQVEAGLILNQLPRAAFSRSPEEITGSLWQGKVELPLARVVDQLPADAMHRSYDAEQASVDEFPEPFKDTLAGAPRRPSPPPIKTVAQEAAPQVAEAEAAAVAPVEEAEVAAVDQVEQVAEELAEAPVSLEPVAEEAPPEPLEEPAPEPVEAPEPEPAPADEELAAAATEQEEVERTEEAEETVPVAPAAEEMEPVTPAPAPVAGAATPGLLDVSAEYIVAQFPENAMAMPIEDIEAKLDPHGRLHVPVDDVLPQLAEGYVAVDVGPLLEQLPPGAVGISWGELANTLPEGKVQLPLDQLVGQISPDLLVPGIKQTEQEATDEIPDPFAEGRARPLEAVAAPPEEAGPPEEAEAPEDAAPPEEAAPPMEAEVVPAADVVADADVVAEAAPEPVAEPESSGEVEEVAAPPEAAPEAEVEEQLEEAPAAAADTIEIAWLELLPQFPADAFRVSREQLNNKLEGSTARVDVDIVRPQLGEGRVTVPCGYLLAQFPDEYLELTVEQITERIPEGRFELPLVSIVLQLPEEELALPTGQALQESTAEIPTVFAEPGTEAAAEPEAAGPGELEAEPEPGPEPEPEPEVAAEAPEPTLVVEAPEEVPEPWSEPVEASAEIAEPAAEAAEPSAEPGDMEGLTESDITQLESLLADKRQEEAAFEDQGEFIDDLFGSEEAEAPDIAAPVLEPEPPVVEEPAIEEPAAEAKPVETGRAAEPPFELDEVEPLVEPVDRAEPVFEPAAEPWELVEEFAPEAAEDEAPEPVTEESVVEEAASEEVVVEERAAEAELVKPAAAERVGAASLAGAAHDNEAFRDLLHGYAKYHVEHGTASVEAGRLVLSFTPAETSAEVLARELSPRFETLARLADSLGCERIERAVLMAEKGAVVCEWLPEEAGAGLVLMATTDRRAAGMMHLQARRDTGSLSRLSAALRGERGAAAVETTAASARPKREPEGCEVAWPDGQPYDQIGDLLGAYDVTTIALLQFASGARWTLASSAPTPSTDWKQGCYNPSELLELPEELRLGKAQSVLAMAGGNIITVNAPAPAGKAGPSGSEPGLICVFPGEFREGLLKMKADKASALLGGV